MSKEIVNELKKLTETSISKDLQNYPLMSDKIRYLFYTQNIKSKSQIALMLSAETNRYVRFQWVYNVLKEPLKSNSPFNKQK